MLWIIAIGAVVVILLLARKPRQDSNSAPAPDTSRQVAEIEQKIADLEAMIAQAESADGEILDESSEDDEAAPAEFFDRGNGRTLTAEIEIDFKDRSGNKTRRHITTRSYQYNVNDGLIDAFCHLRNARRPFLFSRIEQATDLETGQVIGDLRAWLDEKYKLTPAARVDELLDEHWAGLSCLHYVAKADGAFRAKEKHIVRAFLARHSPNSDPDSIDQVIAELSSWYTMSAIGFGKEIRKLAEKPEAYRRDVLATAEAMVETDKTTHSAESNALKRLGKEMFRQN